MNANPARFEVPQCKLILLAGVLLCGGIFETRAQASPPNLRLAGIMNIFGKPQAVVEVTVRKHAETLVLGEGEKQDDVMTERISVTDRTAQLSVVAEGVPTTVILTNLSSEPATTGPSLWLDKVSPDLVLSIYGKLTQRIILQSPKFVIPNLTVATIHTNRTGVVQDIQNVLTNQGLAVIPDGTKFLMVVPTNQVAKLKPHSADPNGGNNADDLLQRGVIEFDGVAVDQVLAIYCKLRKLNLDDSFPFQYPNCGIKLSTQQNALTKSEAGYALETVLEWAGVKVVPEGNGKVKPVAITE